MRNTQLKDWAVITPISVLTFLIFSGAYQLIDFTFLWHSDTAYFTFHKLSIIKQSLSEVPSIPFLNRFEAGGVSLFHAGSVDLTSFFFLRWFGVLDYQITLAFFYVSFSLVTFFLLVRNLGCSREAALIASSFWALNAFNLNYANEHVYAIFHVAVPLSLLAIKWILGRPEHQWLWFIGLVVSNGALLLTGRWALLQYCFVAYILWCFSGGYPWRRISTVIFYVFASLVLAFCVTSFFSVPYLLETIGDTYRAHQQLPPKYAHWLRLFLDHLAPGLSHNSASYFTPAVLIPLAVIGYVIPSSIRFFCLLTFVAFILFTHPFGLFSLIQKLPFQSGNVVTIRFVFFYYLGFALALALGIDHVLGRRSQMSAHVSRILQFSAQHLVSVIVVIVAVVLVVSLSSKFETPLHSLVLQLFPLQNPFAGPVKTAFGLSVAICISALVFSLILRIQVRKVSLYLFPILLFFIVLILVAAADYVPQLRVIHLVNFALFFFFWFLIKTNRAIGRPTILGFLLIYTVVFSITFNSLHSYPEYDMLKVRTQQTGNWKDLAEFLNGRVHQGPFRIAADHDSIVRLASAGFVAEELGYFLPLPPTAIVDFFVKKNGIRAGPAPAHKSRPSKTFREGNVRYYVRLTEAESGGLDLSSANDFELVFSQGPIRLYEDKRVSPRLVFDSQSTESAAFRSCSNRELHNRSEAQELNLASCGSVIALKRYESGVYGFNVSSTAEGVLVVASRFNDNWTFTVNSNEVYPLRVNDFFIGIPITKGVSEVLGIYKIPAFGYMFLLSVGTSLALVFAALYLFARSYRTRGGLDA